jgi:formamidopyrimidine-DNA glycosylase
MPELAEVEFFRKRWSAGHGDCVLAVRLHEDKRVFRGCNTAALRRRLTGAMLLGSAAAAKQMLFRFSGDNWLGLHLGMSGELRVEPPDYAAGRHDHLILVQQARQLVFTDPRMFGSVLFHHGGTAPGWWTGIAPAVLSPAFTVEAVADFLRRHARTPVKAVLLMQERFPGIGNWMADEVLWRAAIHPKRPAGSLSAAEARTLHRECRKVCRLALDTITGRGRYLPPDLNAHIPRSWLFRHRWEDGGRCPRTGRLLRREQIGGRTTCWSPARQKLR